MNYRMLSLSLVFSLSSASSLGTTFLETPIGDRLGHSEGVIQGKFLGSSSKRLPDGKVVTEASFEIMSLSGIKPNEIVNHHNFKVLYPGGSWQGRTYKVHGTPEFKVGEVSYLVLAKGGFGYTLANLGLSKLKPIQKDGETYLQSPIFSKKMGVGLIPLKEFKMLVGATFGENLSAYTVDKYIDRNDSPNKLQKRKPASVKEEEKEKNLSFSMIWLILGMGFLGFVSTLLSKGKKDDGQST